MSWDVEPWQAVETLEPVSSEPLVIDVEWQPVGNTKALTDNPYLQKVSNTHEVIDVPHAFEPANTATELARHVNEYIVTDDDMATAHEWLERVDTMTQSQTQLAATTQTKAPPQTLTALWSWATKPAKQKQQTRSSPVGNQPQVSSGPRWYFVAERDPSEPESLQHLRYWFMQYQYAEGVTEWDEAAFMNWVQGLTDDELATFADAGEQIALGNWQDHVSGPTVETIEKTRASDGRGPVDYFVDAFKGLL